MKAKYGASELKAVYNRNLAMSFGVALILLALLALLYALTTRSEPPRKLVVQRSVIDSVVMTKYKLKKESGKHAVSASGGSTKVSAGNGTNKSTARHELFGKLIAKPDTLKFDTTHIASTTTIRTSSSHSGTDTLDGGSASFPVRDTSLIGGIGIDDPLERPQATPDTDPPLYNAKASEPECDDKELLSHLVYPEIARKNHVDGRVVVRVLIDKRGVPTKHFIEYSDNSLLNDAAVDAVMRTSFKPGQQGDVPVAVWLFIPIKFTLN